MIFIMEVLSARDLCALSANMHLYSLTWIVCLVNKFLLSTQGYAIQLHVVV